MLPNKNGNPAASSPLTNNKQPHNRKKQNGSNNVINNEKKEKLSHFQVQGANLYIKNLEEAIDDQRLLSEFSAFGKITSARVMKNEKGVSKGFGFVCYSTQEEALRAVSEMNGKILVNKPLYVALAQSKEERRAQLFKQKQEPFAYNSNPGFPGIKPQHLFYPMQPFNSTGGLCMQPHMQQGGGDGSFLPPPMQIIRPPMFAAPGFPMFTPGGYQQMAQCRSILVPVQFHNGMATTRPEMYQTGGMTGGGHMNMPMQILPQPTAHQQQQHGGGSHYKMVPTIQAHAQYRPIQGQHLAEQPIIMSALDPQQGYVIEDCAAR